jgi:hypothetical protein
MKIDLAIGSASALAASVIPDTMLAYSEKFLLAVLTSMVATYANMGLRSWWAGRKKAKKAKKKAGKP